MASQSMWTTMGKVYRTQGVSAVAALGLRMIIRPFAQAGSLYFLERDLSCPMPAREPVTTIVAREGTLADVHLLDTMPDAARHKNQAIDRLRRGDHWFVGIDRTTGRLANH